MRAARPRGGKGAVPVATTVALLFVIAALDLGAAEDASGAPQGGSGASQGGMRPCGVSVRPRFTPDVYEPTLGRLHQSLAFPLS
jgi:hypothetical protein